MTEEFRAGRGVDHLDSLVTVLDLIRSDAARTRPEIVRASGLGRAVVTHRVGQLLSSDLVSEGNLGPSTGGRAPRELRFRSDAGHLLVADLGAKGGSVALANLAGELIEQRVEPLDITDGPVSVLVRVAELFEELRAKSPRAIWGVGVGLPGPVEFATGRPVSPPIMPGWDGFGVREFFAERFDVPVWVDNDVNVQVLGELRAGTARAQSDVVFVKVGTGIGAGLVSGGRLHRGAQGCAGDIGHIAAIRDSDVRCRCGQLGCLEALAGGFALARDGAAVAADGRSQLLASTLAEQGEVTAADVGRAAIHGDPEGVRLVTASAQLVGETLSQIVNFFNPAVVLIGGGVTEVGDLYLATVRQAVLKRSMPLATRNLRIERSPLGRRAGLVGAAYMVIDELLSRDRLPRWIERGTPAGLPALTS